MDGKIKMPFGLRMARDAFKRSAYDDIKVGASLINKSKIILAWNEKKTSPAIQRLKYPLYSNFHAEANLFGRMIAPVAGIVFVYRQKPSGMLAIARPCKYCMNVLRLYGIKKVCYTIIDGWQWERID
jgi:tRNA(Arg) A34 adenosine deaminase TadA